MPRKIKRGERHLLRDWYDAQKRDNYKRSYAYWANRWGIDQSLFSKWIQPFDSPTFRRIGPERIEVVFRDLPFSYEEYIRCTPASSNPKRGREAQGESPAA